MQTLLTCLMIWILTKRRWFSFILFLIFLGGLIVLFVYITSLASNEKFELKNIFSIKTNCWIFLFVSTILRLVYFSKNSIDLNNFIFSKIIILFTKNIILPTLIVITYLFLVLVIVVKISSIMEGPIRNYI